MRPPPSLWGFITNSSGFSIAFSTISESSKLHKPAKHSRSLAMSSLLSRNLFKVEDQKLREIIIGAKMFSYNYEKVRYR